MEDALVELDSNKVGRSKSGLVFAGLSIRFGSLTLPHPDWTDNVVVVLSWWTREIAKLLSCRVERVEIRFMEGPFVPELQRVDSRTWDLRLIEAGIERDVQGHGEINVEAFVGSLLAACNQTLELCRAHSWWSSDADALRVGMEALRGEARARGILSS